MKQATQQGSHHLVEQHRTWWVCTGEEEKQPTCKELNSCRGLKQHGCAAPQSLTRVVQLWSEFLPETTENSAHALKGHDKQLNMGKRSTKNWRALDLKPPIPAVPASGEEKQLQRYFQHTLLYPALPTNLILQFSLWSRKYISRVKIPAFIMKSTEKWDPLYSQFCWNISLRKARVLGRVLQIYQGGL